MIRREESAMDELSAQTKERLARVLGEAVARTWSTLPHHVQHDLFEAAVAAEGEAVRHELAIFLHHRHARTADAHKARAMPEPDSLGG
jgi:hypothetical protein